MTESVLLAPRSSLAGPRQSSYPAAVESTSVVALESSPVEGESSLLVVTDSISVAPESSLAVVRAVPVVVDSISLPLQSFPVEVETSPVPSDSPPVSASIPWPLLLVSEVVQLTPRLREESPAGLVLHEKICY